MLESLIIVSGAGYFSGALAGRLGLPPLIGMLLAGMMIGPHALDLIGPELRAFDGEIRTIALVIILTKAGLSLHREQLQAHGTVALRLGVIPCTLEASVIAAFAHYLLGWDWIMAWLLGWIIAAESPAVIVPTMLRRSLLLAGLGGSVLVRRPALGYVVGWAIGDRNALRRDAGIRRLGTQLTLILMIPSTTQLLVEIPLYLAGEIGWLGVVRVILGWPLTFACVGLAGIWMSRGRTPLERPR